MVLPTLLTQLPCAHAYIFRWLSAANGWRKRKPAWLGNACPYSCQVRCASIRVCVCVCASVHVCAFVYVYVWVAVCVCVCVCVCARTRVRACARVCACERVYVCMSWCVGVYVCACFVGLSVRLSVCLFSPT